MFHYPFHSLITTFLAGLTVTPDTVTFYYRVTEFVGHEAIPSPVKGFASMLRQCASSCNGKKYGFLGHDEIEHTLRNLHSLNAPKIFSPLEGHFHLTHCGVVTPEQLQCLLENMVTWQANKPQRLKMANSLWRKNLATKLQKTANRTLEKDDGITPLFESADIQPAVAAYTTYYDANEELINADYAQLKKQLAILAWNQEFDVLKRLIFICIGMGVVLGAVISILMLVSKLDNQDALSKSSKQIPQTLFAVTGLVLLASLVMFPHLTPLRFAVGLVATLLPAAATSMIVERIVSPSMGHAKSS